jgi:hypothetical protein
MPRVAWKNFTEGRALAQRLGLKSAKGWKAWSKSGQRPSDIPAHPETTYRDDGWISWPDWLGSERGAWKSFTEGRAYVQGLELKSTKKWWAWSKSGQRPSDIPASPERTYRDVGWISWNDWLGNGKERVAWKSFTEARALARGLELKGQQAWWAFNKSGQRPSDIPGRPDQAYRNDGWISWPDWLGTAGNKVAPLPFTVGRAYVRKLELKTHKEWQAWSKSGQRPSNIPSLPSRTYRDDGWISWNDWLGYGEGRVLAKDMLPFTVARAYARGLELKSQKGWKAWKKSGQRPSDIPAHPDQMYSDAGWISYPDWLGNGKQYDMLPFTEGRAFARRLGLKGQRGWKEWSKSEQRPSDIPGRPDRVYRDDGWVSWPDWLGNGKARNTVALPFAVGRAYVRKLKLRSWKEWQAWSKSGQRPSNIPSLPSRTYRDDGWISMPDWLGYGLGGGAAASRSSSSSSSATTAPKKKTKKKRKRRPATTHSSDLPPPPPPSHSPFEPTVKTEPPSPKSSGGSSDRSTEPPLRKIKKEEDT